MEENELISVDNNNAVEYTDDNIRHLSDMEHVRTRPGMYIGRLGDGAHAEDGIYVLLKEVIDNSIDEFKMQAGKKIEITVEENLRVSVRDYGRGIPQGKLVEAVSVLNTGGKYDSKAFKKSVGLNGVGVKAVNALSSRFEVRSYRDGKVRIATFSKGNLQTDVTQDTEEDNGTFIFFEPDNTLFVNYCFKPEFIETMLRNYTYLNTGLAIIYNGHRILSRNGLVDLLNDNMTATGLYPIVHLKGEDIEIAFTHTGQYGEEYYSFVNGQHTTQGGTHQSAFKEHIARTIKEFFNKNMDYTDIRNGLVAAIAVNVEEPIFESQTKTKLGSTNMTPGGVTVNKYVGDFIKLEVDNFLHKNADVAEVMQQKIQESEKERKAIAGVTKLARERAKKANLHNRKLRDCRIHLNDPKGKGMEEDSCIFITGRTRRAVTITKSRDVNTQAVFSLRGKPLNYVRTDEKGSLRERRVQPAASCFKYRGRHRRTPLQQSDCCHRCRRRRYAHPPAAHHVLPAILPRPHQERSRIYSADAVIPRAQQEENGVLLQRGRTGERHQRTKPQPGNHPFQGTGRNITGRIQALYRQGYAPGTSDIA